MSPASSPAAAVAAEVPRAEPSSDEERWRRLESLRAELDRVDDALHDGLMRRAALVEQVRAVGAKGRVPLRPGREAAILRRLLGRNEGALAPATLVRVWRELLAGSSAQQDQMRVVVGDAGLLPAVCEHFGALMTAEIVGPDEAVAAVASGRATLAVMPMPMPIPMPMSGGEGRDWWRLLVEERPRGVHVVARLPFWSRAGAPEALVLSAAEPDPSGADRTVVAGEACGRAIARAGETVLSEIDGWVTAAELRARGITARVLGAYAIPIGAES